MVKALRRPTRTQLRAQFAARLRHARERKFDSMIEMAGAIGVQPETYRRWERGETEPGIADLTSILRTLDLSADYLVTGDLPPPPR